MAVTTVVLTVASPTTARNSGDSPNFTSVCKVTTATTVTVPRCAMSKRSHRLLSRLQTIGGDPLSASRFIRNLVRSSPRSLLLSTLHHLLLSDSHLALPMYEALLGTSWYRWDPKTAARLAALLEKHGLVGESETLVANSVERLMYEGGEFRDFYCDLIEYYSRHGLKGQVLDLSMKMAADSRFRTHSSVVNALARLDLPDDAKRKLEEMEDAGFRPSAFEFRSVILSYGRTRRFAEMMAVMEKMEEKLGSSAIDTVCCNMILSSLGDCGKHLEMAGWVKKMKNLGVGFSIRSYNSFPNLCPSPSSGEFKSLPLSVDELIQMLSAAGSANTVILIREMVDSVGLLSETVEWSPQEWRLDLHGFHIGAAYLNLLHWLEVVRTKMEGGGKLPLEVSIVCGVGKHSIVRGESPVRSLVSEMMFRMNSPLKLDRLNGGRFLAKGKSVKEWLCGRPKPTQATSHH